MHYSYTTLLGIWALLISFCLPTTHADLLAYYVDGTDLDAAALVDLAGHAQLTASDLANVGFEGGASITRNEFAAPETPAGPTAGSSAGSQWLFARANTVQAAPDLLTDYFGFSVTPASGTLSLQSLTFDRTSRANSGGGINTTYEAFVSIDNGAFTSFGSSSITAPTTQNTWLPASTQMVDLSSVTGASIVEIRIALGDNSGVASKSSWVQGIQLEGTVIPEPSSLALSFIGVLVITSLRRRLV